MPRLHEPTHNSAAEYWARWRDYEDQVAQLTNQLVKAGFLKPRHKWWQLWITPEAVQLGKGPNSVLYTSADGAIWSHVLDSRPGGVPANTYRKLSTIKREWHLAEDYGSIEESFASAIKTLQAEIDRHQGVSQLD